MKAKGKGKPELIVKGEPAVKPEEPKKEKEDKQENIKMPEKPQYGKKKINFEDEPVLEKKAGIQNENEKEKEVLKESKVKNIFKFIYSPRKNSMTMRKNSSLGKSEKFEPSLIGLGKSLQINPKKMRKGASTLMKWEVLFSMIFSCTICMNFFYLKLCILFDV